MVYDPLMREYLATLVLLSISSIFISNTSYPLYYNNPKDPYFSKISISFLFNFFCYYYSVALAIYLNSPPKNIA